MSAWTFVAAAYAATLAGTAGLLLWAWRSMRVAEDQAHALKRRP